MADSVKPERSIYDRAFRTMLERMPQLIIPVINEVFGTSYSIDETITQHKNELYLEDKKNITDSILSIRDNMYHFECQSNPDNTISIRMIRYDFVIALDNAKKTSKTGEYEIDFPYSCVLYLRHTKNTPDKTTVRINFPDGQTFVYSVPIIKVQAYTKESLFNDRLFMFLPYYIMRYEKQLENIETDIESLNTLLDEYRGIEPRLKNALSEIGMSEYHRELMGLITAIFEKLFSNQKSVKERIYKTMYDDDLIKLPSDYLAEGRAEGRAEREMIAYEKVRNKMLKLGYPEDVIELFSADSLAEDFPEYDAPDVAGDE